MKKPVCFTVTELAERWKVSEACVRRLYTHGEIRPFRFGRTVRIPESEVIRIEEAWGTESFYQ